MKTFFRAIAQIGVIITVIQYIRGVQTVEEATYCMVLMIFIYVCNLEKCNE